MKAKILTVAVLTLLALPLLILPVHGGMPSTSAQVGTPLTDAFTGAGINPEPMMWLPHNVGRTGPDLTDLDLSGLALRHRR
ncbi:MAG: hypothetical protein H5T68_10235 [Chloroflexi bacterium]|nr:hypothetical protein [Chloroflexota bacterium]